jgi:hypothetical protein
MRTAPWIAFALGCSAHLSSVVDSQPYAQAGPSGDAALPTTSTTLAIDATKLGFAIPASYVGISFSRSNISGSNGYELLFDPAHDPSYAHLVNLFQQIGIHHLRTVSGTASASDPDPTAAQDDAFFHFAREAGLPDRSVIYSLHLFNEDTSSTPPSSSDTAAAAHIWASPYDRPLVESFALGNESDWHYNYHGQDPIITGYATPAGHGYKDEWTTLYNAIESAAPSAAFSGPDTGSNYPIETDATSNTSIGGVPFTLRFAIDQRPRIALATQHYYGGSTTNAPVWAAGSYAVNDVVQDPKSANLTYRCIVADPQSHTHPAAAPTYWAAYPPLWSIGASYHVGDEVQDPIAPGTVYRCKQDVALSTADPASATASWEVDGSFPLLGPSQMASFMLSPDRHADFTTLYDNALAGSPTWPSGLAFRFTEANAYSGGRDPASHIFATALWALDFFHWWAQHGCDGVDPFTRVAQYNAPIFQDASGDFVAEPYAYGMLAFGQGGRGTTIDPSGVAFSTPRDWLAAYAVVGASDLYVTLIDTSFGTAAQDAAVMLARPTGFTPIRAQYMMMSSGAASSDATTPSALLGGATIPTVGAWTARWTPIDVNADGTIGPLPVRASTAIVVDVTSG